MFRRVESQEDRHKLQVDLNKLVKWAEKWQMLFNGKGKRCRGHCKFRHEGVRSMWYYSKERKPDIGLDQKEYSIRG